MQKIIYTIINKLFMNEIESDLLNLIKEENKIIFDGGCFRGNFTKNLIKQEEKNNHNSNYYLFDPNPSVKNYLKELLKKDNIKYFQLALDNTNTQKTFTINRYFEPSGSSLNSAHKKDPLYNLSRKAFMKIFQPFKTMQDYEEINVQTQTIDNFCLLNNIEKIDLLKLDTDGTEYEILLGAEKLLSQGKIGLIYTEISGFKKTFDDKVNKIIKLLDKYGFELKKVYKINSFSWFSNLKATDNLFIKKKFNEK
jgi:FkbM family methyltransferase